MKIVPWASWRPVPSHSGPMSAHQGLVLHVQVGNNSCYGEFSVPSNQASSTWWVSKTGVLEQYVDADMAAWTEAAGNFTWDSVETEGQPSEALTDAQVQTLARLYIWGVQNYGWPLKLAELPSQTGFGWHGMGGDAWGGHYGCPGDLRKAQRAAIIYIASLAKPDPVHSNTQGESMLDNVPTGGIIVARPDGAVDCFDGAKSYGSMAGHALAAPIVGIASTPTGKGYTLIGADGGIFNFGDSPYAGPKAKYLQQWGIGVNTPNKIIGIRRGSNSGIAYVIVTDAYPSDTQAHTYEIPLSGLYAN